MKTRTSKKWSVPVATGLGMLAAVILSGCGTTPVPPPQEPEVFSEPPAPKMQNVEFKEDEKPVPLFRISDRNNPQEVIKFARSLTAAGRYKEAGTIYLDAAKRFKSASGNFEIDCRMAAVREFWLAGEFTKAHELLDELEKEQDIYNRAGESEDIRRLRILLRESEILKQAKN